MARVTTHLVDSTSAACLWSEQRDLAHDEILGSMQPGLHLTATFRREIEPSGQESRRQRRPALDMWGWYHLGLREMYRFSMPGLRAAHQHFERAIALDPEFAPALAGSPTLMQMYWYGPQEERAQNLEKGLAAAAGRRPRSEERPWPSRARTSLRDPRRVRSRHPRTRDGDRSRRRLRAGAFPDWGQAYAAAGDPANALAPLDRAIGLDPHDPIPGRSTTTAPRHASLWAAWRRPNGFPG
jgi:tetratricopeptide (TPR) repeat protein